jgi:hypothetical protein
MENSVNTEELKSKSDLLTPMKKKFIKLLF